MPPYATTVLSFIDQVAQFSQSIASKPADAPWTAENTVAGVWMGVNDVGNSFYLEGEAERLVKILDAYFGQLEVLYDAGLRQFALLTVPRKSLVPPRLTLGDALTVRHQRRS